MIRYPYDVSMFFVFILTKIKIAESSIVELNCIKRDRRFC